VNGIYIVLCCVRVCGLGKVLGRGSLDTWQLITGLLLLTYERDIQISNTNTHTHTYVLKEQPSFLHAT